MSIRSGIKAGIRAEGGGHVLSGINPIHLRPLLGLDFTEPVEQPFPLTAPALHATGCGNGLCSMILDFEEASGNVLDHVGSHDLTPTGSPLQAQDAVGVGPVPWIKKAAELQASLGQYFDSGDVSFLDADGVNSFALLLGWRGTPYSLISYLVSNRDTASPNVGWDLDWQGMSLAFRLDEGVVQQTSVVTMNLDDGAWHWILAVADASTGYIRLHIDNASGGADTYNAASSSATFRVGAYTAGARPPPGQCCYMAAWEGAAAEGMGLADLTAFIKHATDPSKLLTTKVHASTIWDLVADGKVGAWHSGQIPIGYNAGLTNVNKMGLRCQNPVSQLLSESDDFDTTWTKSNVTVDKLLADLSDSPRGFRESQKLTATADNGYFQHLFTTVAATECSIYAFLQRYSSMGTDVTGRIVAYDNIGAAEIDSQVFSGGADWSAKPIALMFTTPAGCTQVGYRIEIDVSGEIICAALATAVAGKVSVPIYTTGGTVAVAGTDWRVEGSAGQYCRAGRGEIKATCIHDTAVLSSPTEHVIVRVRPNAGANNKRWLEGRSNTQQVLFRLFDGAGGLYDSLYDATLAGLFGAEQTYTAWWSATTEIASKHAQFIRGGVAKDDNQGAGYATTENLTNVSVGTHTSANHSIQGLLTGLRIYDRPRTVL